MFPRLDLMKFAHHPSIMYGKMDRNARQYDLAKSYKKTKTNARAVFDEKNEMNQKIRVGNIVFHQDVFCFVPKNSKQ